MCGLVGFLRPSAMDRRSDEELLRRMAAAVRHRGPDDEGIWTEGLVGLGHRRLSVIDTSAAGRQPMVRDGHALVLNGEIYNYRELRRDLEAAGEVFSTATDTEVLLILLRRYGKTGLARVNGMFAFAYWNGVSRELILGRDRIGKKPLYYAESGGSIVFGSEIKALLADPAIRREPDTEAIHHYLTLQYVPAPLTAFRNVRALPPATLMTCRPGETPRLERYWSLPTPTQAEGRAAPGREALCEELRHVLRSAVRRRLVADVPVGAFLSGGIDSSTVTALMARESGRRISTFSVGFSDDAYDERRYARMVAERYGTDHHEDVVTGDATDLLPDIVRHYGQPFADPSAIPTFYLSRLARRSVTVALSGDGGDEFFLGYDRYEACRRRQWPDTLPAPLRRLAGAAAARTPRALATAPILRTVRRVLALAGATRAQRYEPTIAYFMHAEKPGLYGPVLAGELASDTIARLTPFLEASPTLMEGAAFADAHTYLPDDILVKVDVASMAFGLEARAPFLDVELVEWAARLPASVRAPGGRLKGLLKDAVAEDLPEAVISRPKMGFGAPIDIWLRGGFSQMARDVLTSRRALERGLFEERAVTRLLDEHASGRHLHHTRLWALLMLELWFAMWIDASDAPTAMS